MTGSIALTLVAAGLVAVALPAISLLAARRSAHRVDQLEAASMGAQQRVSLERPEAVRI